MKRCSGGDRAAWDEFTRRYTPLVTRSVKYKLGKLGVRLPGADIPDIVQDVFISLWEKNRLSDIKDPLCLDSWLVIITLNATSNHCRNNKVFRSRKVLSLDAGTLPEEIAAPACARRGMEADEIRDIMDEELSNMSRRQRLALKFHIYDGKTQKDIAEIMNIPAGTVATLIKRGKRRLREKLRDYEKN